MTSSSNNSVDLKVRGLKKSYDGNLVLKGIDFVAEAHTIFVIMGPSGSGKSVLLRHLIGLEVPDSGEVLMNDASIHDPATREKLELAIVFQSGGLLNSLSVGENVGLYLKETKCMRDTDIDPIVNNSLEKVGLSVDIDKHKMPSALSGGMKKRVAIARALAINPQMIFYDEPTSELDPLSAVTIGKEIQHLNQEYGTTSIVVTHDRDLAFGIGHKIAFMKNGVLTEPRSPEEITQHSDEETIRFLNAGSIQDYQNKTQ
ncbi:MAG: ATP-binding cassette domain-containing protein [Verrucomicrobia bacterium]|jgi:phospholipid/cholesterol/gamma-HCH transport system ATP-binding protein|nr:ATP-binding cassette domain-containing protein [Verrucomicrobiota bacterium]